MPRAEVGSTKYLNNKLKSKGLQRLRWYCQVCEKQCRDANGFKCHTQSESHVRQMLVVGEDPRKAINDFSNQFNRDFLQLLRTAHGEKKVHVNHFYQEYIANKEHVHMNATKWPSLTEYTKHLGREGICRVEEIDKGLHIAWIDNSPEALRRQDAIRKKERQDRGDEEREQRLIAEQIARAERDVDGGAADHDSDKELKRAEGEKIKLNFGTKKEAIEGEKSDPVQPRQQPTPETEERSSSDERQQSTQQPPSDMDTKSAAPEKVSMKIGISNKPKNVFASAKKNALSSSKVSVKEAPKKPMSEAERIMKDEIERKRMREVNGFSGLNVKRQKVS